MCACGEAPVRDVSVTRATEAMDASASPRNPSDPTASRSSSERILLVAWRASAIVNSSPAMPPPLSSTWMRAMPPASRSTWTSVAPESRLFSRSSFSTEAGRSTTSPAAIWLIRRSGRTWIALMREV